MHSLEGVIEGVHVRDVDALLSLLLALSPLARPFVRIRKGADFVACDNTKSCERKKTVYCGCRSACVDYNIINRGRST
jgi:hypothetical protein